MTLSSTYPVYAPLRPGEGIEVAAAAKIADVAERTIRAWCSDHQIGIRVAGRWRVSRVALDMLLAGDLASLDLWREGDRESARVVRYYDRCGLRFSPQYAHA